MPLGIYELELVLSTNPWRYFSRGYHLARTPGKATCIATLIHGLIINTYLAKPMPVWFLSMGSNRYVPSDEQLVSIFEQ